MKNDEIIEQIARDIYGDTVVDEMVSKGQDLGLHTISGWRSIAQSRGGHAVIKNDEHGIECKLWRKREKGEDSNGQFYLTKCFLFTRKQVEFVEKVS